MTASESTPTHKGAAGDESNEAILDRVRTVLLARRSDLGPQDVQASAPLHEAPLAFDSLDLAEFMVALEIEFNIIAVDQDFLSLRTIGDAVTFVEQARQRG